MTLVSAGGREQLYSGVKIIKASDPKIFLLVSVIQSGAEFGSRWKWRGWWTWPSPPILSGSEKNQIGRIGRKF